MDRFVRLARVVLEFIGYLIERTAVLAWRFVCWSGPRFFEALGAAIEHAARSLWRNSRQLCFGTWRRSLVTAAIGSLALVHFFPEEMGPLMGSLWTIGFTVLGMSVMYYGIWRALFPPQQRRRRRRD